MGYLYRHIRLDKNEVFYVGISLKDDEQHRRAYNKTYRSEWWKRIAAKTDYDVEIIMEGLSASELKEKEKEFIAIYGRMDTGCGTLCNMTDGGQGMSGYKMTASQRRKLSIAKKGISPSEKTIKAAIAAKKGKPLAKAHRDKLSRKVIDVKTGVVYPSTIDAAKANNLNIRTLRDYLNGRILNKTSLRYMEGDKSILSRKTDRSYGANGNAKKIINIETGIVHDSIKEAAICYNLSAESLYQQIRGKNKNKTSLRYLNEKSNINSHYNIYS